MNLPPGSTEPKVDHHHRFGDEIAQVSADHVAKVRDHLNDPLLLAETTYLLLSSVFEKTEPTLNQEHHRLLHFFLNRGMETFRSVMVLYANGCDQDAIQLFRSLIVTATALRYMLAQTLQFV